MYILWQKQFKPWKVLTVVGSIVVVSAVTYCALSHSECDLNTAQMNVLHSLFQELMLSKFELGHNAVEATPLNFLCEGAVDYSN